MERVLDAFWRHVSIDVIGISGRSDLPDWVNRIPLSVHATQSYPGFVNWFTQQHFDIGIAPLVGSPFKPRQVVAEDLGLCGGWTAGTRLRRRGIPCSLADGPAGWLLPDDQNAWFWRSRSWCAMRRCDNASARPHAPPTRQTHWLLRRLPAVQHG